MDIKIVWESQSDTDFSLGFIDGKPAVFTDETGVKCGYLIDAEKMVFNQYDNCYWYIDDDGKWGNTAYCDAKWRVDGNCITEGGPDWTDED